MPKAEDRFKRPHSKEFEKLPSPVNYSPKASIGLDVSSR